MSRKKRAQKADALESATPARTTTRRSKSSWKLMDRGSTIAGGLLAREVSMVVWRAATGRKPPAAGRHPEVATSEAVAWAVIGGSLVEVVKLLVRRWAATYWVRSTGDLPPGMKPLKSQKSSDLAAETTKPASSQKPAGRSRRLRRR